MLTRAARHLIALIIALLLGAFFSAALLRFAPGSDADEQQLDPRLNAASIQALRQSRSQEESLIGFYFHYLNRAFHGDLGSAHSLGQPVRSLIRERAPVTARLVVLGLGLGWTLAIAFAFTTALMRTTLCDAATMAASSLFLCFPAAVLALLSVLLSAPGYLAIGLVVFPKVFRYLRNLLFNAFSLPHIQTARAKGLSEFRIIGFHVLPVVAPEILALAGVSVSIAVGAAIPVEALCGLAGVGALAWQAALERDLPLLVTITVIVTLVTLIANFGADIASHLLKAERF